MHKNGIIINCEGKHTRGRNYRNICRYFPKVFVDFFEKVRIISFCMDTKKDSKIQKFGSLPDLSKDKIVVGSKQLRKAVKNGRARCVFLAENADPAITEPIEALCLEGKIKINWVASMADLGRACGIEVGAAAAAAVD